MLVVTAAVVSALTQGPRATVGQPAPPIVGTTLDGGRYDLATYRGRPVLVNFWGPSCVPCRTEVPLLSAKLAQHQADGLAIVGVLAVDPPDTARRFAEDFSMTWPTVIDPEGRIAAAYRFAARPQTYFIDREGILRWIQIGELTEADFERQYARIAA
ncbi:MAG TPA: TlpA disulfide reductase family protein [Candidatus Limnocylindrales bacterium]|nr:TlpA disulfide reductase family protein [Candidatus Limnocylindrales bacterium]